MTRSKRFLAAMITGYAATAANLVFSLVSLPLALVYLEKEQFGLWALATQINSYISLIDLGMSSAVSRYIADHKDDIDGGEYGSHLLTGGIVFFIQAICMLAAGIGFSYIAPEVMNISGELAAEFRKLLILLCATTAFSVAFRSFSAPLWAFQRADVLNICAAVVLLLNLGLLWLAFSMGLGVMSMVLSPIPGIVITIGFTTWFCIRRRYYPTKGAWGRPKYSIFKQTFSYGRDVLLVNLGAQLANASQIMVATRYLGLETAATLAVGTKISSLAAMLVLNPISSSAPALTELYVRSEIQQFTRRYMHVFSLVIILACVAALGIVTANRTVVEVWTHGKIQWNWTCDLLLGAMFLIKSSNGYMVGMFGIVKNWKPVRFLYLLEGVTFIPTAILLGKHYGIEGILTAGILANLCVTTLFASRKAQIIVGSLQQNHREIMLSLGLMLCAWALSGLEIFLPSAPAWNFALASLICALSAIFIFQFVIPSEFKILIIQVLQKYFPKSGLSKR